MTDREPQPPNNSPLEKKKPVSPRVSAQRGQTAGESPVIPESIRKETSPPLQEDASAAIRKKIDEIETTLPDFNVEPVPEATPETEIKRASREAALNALRELHTLKRAEGNIPRSPGTQSTNQIDQVALTSNEIPLAGFFSPDTAHKENGAAIDFDVTEGNFPYNYDEESDTQQKAFADFFSPDASNKESGAAIDFEVTKGGFPMDYVEEKTPVNDKNKNPQKEEPTKKTFEDLVEKEIDPEKLEGMREFLSGQISRFKIGGLGVAEGSSRALLTEWGSQLKIVEKKIAELRGKTGAALFEEHTAEDKMRTALLGLRERTRQKMEGLKSSLATLWRERISKNKTKVFGGLGAAGLGLLAALALPPSKTGVETPPSPETATALKGSPSSHELAESVEKNKEVVVGEKAKPQEAAAGALKEVAPQAAIGAPEVKKPFAKLPMKMDEETARFKAKIDLADLVKAAFADKILGMRINDGSNNWGLVAKLTREQIRNLQKSKPLTVGVAEKFLTNIIEETGYNPEPDETAAQIAEGALAKAKMSVPTNLVTELQQEE